ncbi:MAG: metallophosphoesterase [Candidatus Aenigmatarchaeota archaeon]
MLIFATSDVHYPTNKDLFLESLKKLKENPDLFLLAGDMSEAFHPNQWKNILKALEKISCPIVAVPGNTEFDENIDLIKEICKGKIVFLNNEIFRIEVENKKISIFGSRGVLDEPTPWQKRNIPEIEKKYEEIAENIKKLVKKEKGDIKILLTHYSPSYLTVEGEMESIKPQLATHKLDEILNKNFLTIAIHGHAHFGTKFAQTSIPIYNVALPLNREIVVIKLLDK